MSRTASASDSDASLSSSDEPPSESAPDLSAAPSAVAFPPAWNTSSSAAECRTRDWRWQLRNRIRAVEQLAACFPGMDAAGAAMAARKFPLAITPYYASLIRAPYESDPIFRMVVPDARELQDPPFLSDDPLAEDADMPVPGLVHRYVDRVLLLATTTCAAYCRHCTRKRLAGAKESTISQARLAQAVAYLRSHPQVRDVIISGGDPLTMTTEALERVLAAVRAVPSVEIVRIGTRAPVVLPQRVTDELVGMLRRYHPLWMNTHFNHPQELTPQAAEACARLVDAGIPLGNQSVLLRGINDEPQVMEELVRGLVRMRVRPYYLFQCDLVRGVEHFRTPLARGLEIMEYLRGRVGGMGIPLFAVDAPQGGGKIPIMPDYVVSASPDRTILRNLKGTLVSYPEPCAPAAAPLR